MARIMNYAVYESKLTLWPGLHGPTTNNRIASGFRTLPEAGDFARSKQSQTGKGYEIIDLYNGIICALIVPVRPESTK